MKKVILFFLVLASLGCNGNGNGNGNDIKTIDPDALESRIPKLCKGVQLNCATNTFSEQRCSKLVTNLMRFNPDRKCKCEYIPPVASNPTPNDCVVIYARHEFDCWQPTCKFPGPGNP